MCPRGQSLRARMIVVELAAGQVDARRLTAAQSDAAAGLYAGAVSGFVRWLAAGGRIAAVWHGLRAEVTRLRGHAAGAAGSPARRRTPEVVANLAVGFRHFLCFARECGGVAAEEAEALWSRCWSALCEAVGEQAAHQAASEPARRFVELLASAVSSGNAHLARGDGGDSADPQAWGWRLRRWGPATTSGTSGSRRASGSAGSRARTCT